MFSAERAESAAGMRHRPPWRAVVLLPPAPAPTPIVTVGVVPVRPVASDVSVATSCSSKVPFQVTSTFAVFTGPPVAWMLAAPMLLSASSAAAICAAVALNAIGAVVCPLNVSVNVPPVAFVTRTVWFSSVFWSML